MSRSSLPKRRYRVHYDDDPQTERTHTTYLPSRAARLFARATGLPAGVSRRVVVRCSQGDVRRYLLTGYQSVAVHHSIREVE